MIEQNILKVRDSIREACKAAQRAPDEVQLLAVSKKHPAQAIREAFESGQRFFAENYCQEALDKQQALSDLDIEWHFIGPIQSNKTRSLATHFDWIHSLDRLKIATRLNDQRPEDMPPLNVLIQYNVDQESQKAGADLTEITELTESIVQLPKLKLRGLMAIPDPEQNPEISFAKVAQVFKTLQKRYDSIDTLSMGMSNDLAPAIANGATMVRIGTAIFGQRT